ncbi:hypothetical protein NE237_025809 [Protea cynaroides]|uniref:Uncharacterized protein n=1 Tax=Protea cynaroides TaxID=273540 RepID=A0A9Q0K241_9MAGN|nr:hypothetical protein NE237_025809 [Protea cynaroides]
MLITSTLIVARRIWLWCNKACFEDTALSVVGVLNVIAMDLKEASIRAIDIIFYCDGGDPSCYENGDLNSYGLKVSKDVNDTPKCKHKCHMQLKAKWSRKTMLACQNQATIGREDLKPDLSVTIEDTTLVDPQARAIKDFKKFVEFNKLVEEVAFSGFELGARSMKKFSLNKDSQFDFAGWRALEGDDKNDAEENAKGAGGRELSTKVCSLTPKPELFLSRYAVAFHVSYGSFHPPDSQSKAYNDSRHFALDSGCGRQPHCTHCDKMGHTCVTCFLLHGYPEGHFRRTAMDKHTQAHTVMAEPIVYETVAVTPSSTLVVPPSMPPSHKNNITR